MSDLGQLRTAALALLNNGAATTKRSGQFLGQLVGEPQPLSDKQLRWLVALAERAGTPELVEGLTHD